MKGDTEDVGGSAVVVDVGHKFSEYTADGVANGNTGDDVFLTRRVQVRVVGRLDVQVGREGRAHVYLAGAGKVEVPDVVGWKAQSATSS